MARKVVGYVGVDPGQRGAAAVVAGGTAAVTDLELVGGKKLDVVWWRDFLRAALKAHRRLVVVLENVHADAHFGGGRAFALAQTVLKLEAVVTLFSYDHKDRVAVLTPTPPVWKRAVIPAAMERVAGEPARRRAARQKGEAVAYAAANFPGVPLVRAGERKPSHDRAEALCLAEYGRLRAGGGG